jgi:hypothetical protein
MDALACDDGDPCTEDHCVEGRCETARAADLPLVHEATIPAMGLNGLALGVDSLLLTRVHEARSRVERWDLSTLPAASLVLDRAAEADDGDFVGVMPFGEGLLLHETPARLRTLAADGAAGRLYLSADPVQATVALEEQLVLAAVFAKGLEVVDFGPDEPQRTLRVDTPGRALDVAVAGRYWLVADGLAGVSVVDTRAEPPRHVVEAQISTDGRVKAVAVADGLAVLAEAGAGLGVIDALADGGPKRLAVLPLGGEAHDVAWLAPGLAAAATDGGLFVVDLLRPEAPTVWGQVEGTARQVVARAGLVAVAGDDAVDLYRLACAAPAEDAGVDAGVAQDALPADAQ